MDVGGSSPSSPTKTGARSRTTSYFSGNLRFPGSASCPVPTSAARLRRIMRRFSSGLPKVVLGRPVNNAWPRSPRYSQSTRTRGALGRFRLARFPELLANFGTAWAKASRRSLSRLFVPIGSAGLGGHFDIDRLRMRPWASLLPDPPAGWDEALGKLGSRTPLPS